MTREGLRDLVVQTSREDLPSLVGALAEAQAEALSRIAAPPATPAGPELVPLTEAWAAANGWRFETAQKLARSRRLEGAMPAPSSGKGRRRRWLVPATLRAPGGR